MIIPPFMACHRIASLIVTFADTVEPDKTPQNATSDNGGRNIISMFNYLNIKCIPAQLSYNVWTFPIKMHVG